MNVDKWQLFNEDIFEEFFQPYSPDGVRGREFNGYGLLTHADWDIVRKSDKRFVWTVTSSEGEFIISPGFHFVNAYCFLVTMRSHDFKFVDFSTYRERPFLTDIGKKRQLNRLSRIYSN